MEEYIESSEEGINAITIDANSQEVGEFANLIKPDQLSESNTDETAENNSETEDTVDTTEASDNPSDNPSDNTAEATDNPTDTSQHPPVLQLSCNRQKVCQNKHVKHLKKHQ